MNDDANRKGDVMNLEAINTRATYLKSIPMGPERWGGEIELRHAKAQCPEYRSNHQEISFADWLKALGEDSKKRQVNWASDEIRAGYYEGQPETWIDLYDDGYSPSDAITEDMTYWE